MPKFDFDKFDNNTWAANEKVAAQVQRIFDQSVLEACALVAPLEKLKSGAFTFDKYPQLKQRINKVFQKLAKNLQQNIFIGNQQAWSLSIKKNDAFVDYLSKRTGIPKRIIDRVDPRNDQALSAFQKRKDGGLGLSDKVWKITEQSRQEIELAIDQGLGLGKSASQLSSTVRQLLQEPDKLFRRVRDKHGQLHLSRQALAYNPGKGVYRSSYKNAMRLTRTENNMAYREADFIRWNTLDFVVGVEVRLSNNPKHCPMCLQLVGKYPKEFKFSGWHPQCRCYATPIINTEKEFEKMTQMYLDDETPDVTSKNRVGDVPDNFKAWIEENKKRIKGWSSIPYFVKDNFLSGDINSKLSLNYR